MEIDKLIESLSVNEARILPHIEEKKVSEISKKTGLDGVSVLRALEYLEKKGIVSLNREKRRIVEVGVNGAFYRKKGLPEIIFLTIYVI